MTKKIFIIAGEPSGDALGAGLIRSLRAEDETIECIGIGGALMEAEGFESLLPMDELCVMGLFEVLSQLPRLLKLINGVVEEVEEADPDVLVTIDLPDFNFQVGKRLKKRATAKTKIIHYVAPSVWAWRESRAKKISEFLDGLMCLFPFEPEHFEKHELPSKFVGHPVIEIDPNQGSATRFREEFSIEPEQKIIGMFLGSRQSELKKLSSTLMETVEILVEQYPDLIVIVPTLPHLEFNVRELLGGWGVNFIIVPDLEKKWDAFAACDAAIAVSGTVGLELAYMKVPHVIGYKMNPLSWLLVKSLVKVKYAHLANILLDKSVVPECLQGQFTSKELSKNLLKLLKFEDVREEQAKEFEALRSALQGDLEGTPSEKAARFVNQYISGV